MTEFTTLNEEAQRIIIDTLKIQEYKKGTFLLQQGDVPGIKFYFVGVLDSSLRMYKEKRTAGSFELINNL
ncbi:hypothetical protein [Bacillus sp. OV322]|uniref:hypothetical protein n=1 Tax=Bacillus sp. OV322 TaxID=1882764 RepID=UPI003527A37B